MSVCNTIVKLANHIQSTLGPGYSERIYHNAMEVLLRKNNISYDTERIIPVYFEEHVIGHSRADLVVDNSIIIELKAIACINNSVRNQAKTYINNTGFNSIIILNFTQSEKKNDLQFEILHN